MLQAIKQFFDRYMDREGEAREEEHRLRLATAALLIEMTRMDEVVRAEEREAVMRAVQSKFELPPDEIEVLMRLADEEVRQATDYHQFTALINKGFDANQKVRIVEHLWAVAYADGRLNPYEEHLVRKVAELLYVPHQAFIAAKHRVTGR